MTALDRNDIFFASARTPSPIIAAQPAPRSRDGRINPHVTRCFLRDGRVTDLFHVKPVYYETRDGFWRPLSEITAHHGNRRIVLKPEAMSRASVRFIRWLSKRQSLIDGGLLEFGYPDTFYWGVQPRDLYTALSLVAYPDPNPESVTIDGDIQRGSGSWAVTRNAASGSSARSNDDTVEIRSNKSTNYGIFRGFFLFDTSAIGDNDTITAATLSLYATAKTNDDNDGDDYLSLVSSLPATNTALITSDYNKIGSTEYAAATPDIGSISLSAYNVLTLNEAGRNTISKTGVSKFAVREGHDFEDQAPLDENSVTVSSADHTGTTQDPKLTVTYTAAGATVDDFSVVIF